MSILEGVMIGIVTLSFLGVMYFALADLVRDILFYKEKKKNVKSMEEHVKNSRSRTVRRDINKDVKTDAKRNTKRNTKR